ncbi:cytochrome c peroxidase [Isosphaeraceae bacterium EP7]
MPSPQSSLGPIGRTLAGWLLLTLAAQGAEAPHRSPVALSLSTDGSRLLTANQTSGSVSLVDPRAGEVLHELATGDKPAGVAFSADATRAAVTHWYGYDLVRLDIKDDRLAIGGRVEVGPEPRGVVVSPDGKTAYVAVGVANEVVRVDLDAMKVTGRVAVGREPRSLALTPDGSRLIAANSRGRTLSFIDPATFQVVNMAETEGDNQRQLAIDSRGEYAYVVHMKNRGFATTRNSIDQGWVLGQRLTRVKLTGDETFESLALDPQGEALGDVHGVAITRDGSTVAVSAGGTHEVVILGDARTLPYRTGGSRDLIPGSLLREKGRVRRIPLGGRPTELAFAPDGPTLYAANYLSDSVQVIDAATGTLTKTIALGGPSEPGLARRGEMLFHDAKRSFNQWYSCNTCHSDGHTNGLDYDTLNDGSQDLSTAHLRSRKKAPTLRGVASTGPWTWHGWQTSLEDATIESFTKSMQGKAPTDEEVKALVAYLGTLDHPKNPNLAPDGSLTESARRGEDIYRSPKAACNTCHGGANLTDGKVHLTGLEEPGDAYRGYNPPSLKGAYDKAPYLHDGRSETLRDALKGPHSPEEVTGLGELTEQELDDLIAYVKSL